MKCLDKARRSLRLIIITTLVLCTSFGHSAYAGESTKYIGHQLRRMADEAEKQTKLMACEYREKYYGKATVHYTDCYGFVMEVINEES